VLELFSLKIVISINNSVVHFVVEAMKVCNVGHPSEDGVALITDPNLWEITMKNKIENIKDNEANTICPNRGDGRNDKKNHTNFAIKIFLLIEVFSSTTWTTLKMPLNMLFIKSEVMLMMTNFTLSDLSL
jgi:hypothetical protein